MKRRVPFLSRKKKENAEYEMCQGTRHPKLDNVLYACPTNQIKKLPIN